MIKQDLLLMAPFTVVSAMHDTQAGTVGTEQALGTAGSAGVYVFALDTHNLVDTDAVTVRIKTKAIHDGTSRVAYVAEYSHVQAEPNKHSAPIKSDTELIITLEQTAGTNRDFDWNLLKVK